MASISAHLCLDTGSLPSLFFALWAFAETSAALDWVSCSGESHYSALNGLSQEDKPLVPTTLVSYLVHWTQQSAC